MVERPCEATEVLAGWEALRAGDWSSARERFSAAVADDNAAEALEGLGWASYFLDDESATIEVRERAYHRYLDDGDEASAARVAAWLAADHIEFRGESAVANGWLQRARRLLMSLPTGPDHGWLAIHEASVCLLDDPLRAMRLGAEAADLGRRFDVPELEMVGLATEGQAAVLVGDVEVGMRQLDEASALALSSDAALLACVAWACCYLISACEQIRDYDRAGQWGLRMTDFCEQRGIGVLLGQCRAKYGAVLAWQGRYAEAEEQLHRAERELSAARPALVAEVVVRLADLRLEQGRTEEAADLYQRADGHLHTLLGRAKLALRSGDVTGSVVLAERLLRRFPAEDPERSPALELLVQAAAIDREAADGEHALAELHHLADRIGTSPLRAAALRAEGVYRLAEEDADGARLALEDAVDLLTAAGAPAEAARTRVQLAAAIAATGRAEAAARERATALAQLRDLGIDTDHDTSVISGQSVTSPQDRDVDGPLRTLTPRELEVLGLVADGMTNRQIAAQLVLSEHTVHRHVANILRKLQVTSRTAATSLALRHGRGTADVGLSGRA